MEVREMCARGPFRRLMNARQRDTSARRKQTTTTSCNTGRPALAVLDNWTKGGRTFLRAAAIKRRRGRTMGPPPPPRPTCCHSKCAQLALGCARTSRSKSRSRGRSALLYSSALSLLGSASAVVVLTIATCLAQTSMHFRARFCRNANGGLSLGHYRLVAQYSRANETNNLLPVPLVLT